MSPLTDRITEVLREHGDGPFINADCTGAGCECGWSGGQEDSWFRHVAERIEDELQLKLVRRHRLDDLRKLEGRWVSAWSEVEQ